ncbi:MAG: ferredoxin family protein [Syntrophomonadaceae bacterium]|nr:ferredoxin family protein [Syntrophomonadaceae bacterium]
MKRLTLEQLLNINKYVLDPEEKSIVLNKEICATCSTKPCIWACPAGLYFLKEEEVGFDPAGCLECGTCRVICPYPGAIDWQYPRGGFGVVYRYG